MRKLFSILLIAAAVTSCNKPTEETKQFLAHEEEKARAEGDLTYTIQMDSLKEVWGRDTVKFNFTTDPQWHSKQMFDMWKGDAAGNTWASGNTRESGGYGVRFSPIDPRDRNAEQVLQSFTWYMEAGGKIIANIGGNRAEISVINGSVILHQIPGPRPNEIERWYYGRQVTNGLNMKGNGAKRAG